MRDAAVDESWPDEKKVEGFLESTARMLRSREQGSTSG